MGNCRWGRGGILRFGPDLFGLGSWGAEHQFQHRLHLNLRDTRFSLQPKRDGGFNGAETINF
jgi:hypothetical protein